MKTTLTIAILVIVTGVAKAQKSAPSIPKQLPDTARIILSKAEYLRIDSAVQIMQSRLDSKSETQWFLHSFDPFYRQIEAQKVADQKGGRQPSKN